MNRRVPTSPKEIFDMAPIKSEAEVPENVAAKESSGIRLGPIVVGVIVAIAMYFLLYWLLAVNGSDVARIYRHRSGLLQLLSFLEKALFLPTIWVTKPMASIAWERGFLAEMTFAEVCVLSVSYGLLAGLAVARRVRWAMSRCARYWWCFAIVGVAMAGVAIWAQTEGGHGLRDRELHEPSPAESAVPVQKER